MHSRTAFGEDWIPCCTAFSTPSPTTMPSFFGLWRKAVFYQRTAGSSKRITMCSTNIHARTQMQLRTEAMVSKNQSVVVTGVSTGIGLGISKILIANGFQVYGSVRRQTDADRLADEFGGAFTPLVMDVTDRESVNRAALQVEEQLGSKTLTGLVNNAGIPLKRPLLYLHLEDC